MIFGFIKKIKNKKKGLGAIYFKESKDSPDFLLATSYLGIPIAIKNNEERVINYNMDCLFFLPPKKYNRMKGKRENTIEILIVSPLCRVCNILVYCM